MQKESNTNLVPRAFLRRGEDGPMPGSFPAHSLLGGEKPWERGCTWKTNTLLMLSELSKCFQVTKSLLLMSFLAHVLPSVMIQKKSLISNSFLQPWSSVKSTKSFVIMSSLLMNPFSRIMLYRSISVSQWVAPLLS